VDAGVFPRRYEVGVGEVEAGGVEVERPPDHRLVFEADGGNAQHRAQQFAHLRPRLTIGTLQHEHALGHVQVQQEQLVRPGITNPSRRSCRLIGWVSREVAYQNVGVEERHRTLQEPTTLATSIVLSEDEPPLAT